MAIATLTQNTQRVFPTPVDVDIPADDHSAQLRAASKPEEPVAARVIDAKISDTLEQILDVLRGSTIAEEQGKDVESRFWATYKRVSNEHDDDFLGRANDDMAIILTFAGLFSAVNSTFIIGTQPNPGNTTNALMVQLIQIIANGPNAGIDISNLSSSTGYPSSTLWMQTLAYASLSFSVLAAFGAVMGKQWLNSYKAAQGRGSSEERGLQRQRKLDGLELWHLQTVLGAFLILLQISLLLFGLSLSANMFARQHTISSVIICTTALGVLFYVATILVSVLQPDSPFQTAESALIRSVLQKIVQFSTYLRLNMTYFHQRHSPPVGSISTPNAFNKSSAIRWILETSTNPEVVEAAAAMVPRVQWSPKLDASLIYARLFDTLKTCVDRPEPFVTYRKAMAHLRIQSTKLNFPYFMESSVAWRAWGDRSQFIRDASMDAHLACERRNNAEDRNTQQKHEDDTRTALRTILVHGLSDYLLPPDNEHLIWNGDFRWHHSNGNAPSSEEFDWLIDYLVEKVNDGTDPQTEGDALLALSAMHGLGSSAKRSSYVNALTRCMAPTRPSRVRYAALRTVSDARDELASITSGSTSSDSPGIDKTLLDELSRALLVAVHPNHNQAMQDSSLAKLRDCCYLRFIFALSNNDEWRKRLTRDGHVDWCISLRDEVLASSLFIDKVYLAGTILRINPSRNNVSLNPTHQQWWMLIQRAWNRFYLPLPSHSNLEPADMNIIEALQALITTTKQYLRNPGNRVVRAELAKLRGHVHNVLENLKRTQERLSQADASLDAALLTVQSLYNELTSYVEHGNTSQ